MGKRKIGEIYNRPIIEGDINLKTSSEIHKSELSVPQSGGSGGDTIEYLDVSGMELSKNSKLYILAGVSIYGKALLYGGAILGIGPSTAVLSTMTADVTNITIKAIAMDFSAPYAEMVVETGQGGAFTIKDMLLRYGFTENELNAIPRITEEEFYNLDI